MNFSSKSFVAQAILGAATLSILATSPASAVVVDVGGLSYDVSVFTTSQQDSAADFAPLASLGRMPWWKDGALAATFAQKASAGLGAGSDPDYGPIFAYDFDPGTGTVAGFYQLLSDINVQDLVIPAPTATDRRQYAIASTPAPGPLPLFGAAAAFGWSRRLRQRSPRQTAS